MTRDDDDHADNDNGFAHGFGTSSPGKNQRVEPTFSRFDGDDEYEEPDRDADHTPGYDAEHTEDFDDDYADDGEPDLFEDEDTDSQYDADVSDEDEPDTWLENEDYPEEEEERGQSWPLSLIAVAVVALMLLAAGGYGVMQQRAATEEELRDLRAKLATAAIPRDGGAGLPVLEELQLAYDTLATEADVLRLENRTLSDTVAGLEAQLGNQQKASAVQPRPASDAPAGTTAKPVQPIATPAPAPARSEPAASQPVAPRPVASQPTAPQPAAPQPAAPKPAAAVSAGPWFVNFGSYATRNMAESWAARLQPGAGKVVIMPNTSDGRTLYRLRVIALADRASAQQVARKLETDLRVSELWVGRE